LRKSPNDKAPGPIGIFDSGFGGLTILREIVEKLPQHDFVYLGDNARAPYGSRSFETVYQYTLECVQKLFGMGCHLVLLACNTASAKALRAIQQTDLPRIAPDRRVLGVIRPTTELIGNYTKTGHVGILGTAGTVSSGSYLIEIERFYPEVRVYQEACPMWVPLIENNEIENEGAEYFIRRHINSLMDKQEKIDAVILGCTHYPLIQHKIRKYLPAHVSVVAQGPIVAEGLYDYLERHPEMDERCSRSGIRKFFTTDETASFDAAASLFYGNTVRSEHIDPN
jgi:glutamate racemase